MPDIFPDYIQIKSEVLPQLLEFFQIRICLIVLRASVQGRREPNVGPGPAQIWRISGFVNSKTEGENAAVLSELWCDLKKKKGLHRNFNGFSGRNLVISKKEKSLHWNSNGFSGRN